jgi:hypothetical protein
MFESSGEMEMRWKHGGLLIMAALLFCGMNAWADQIILKDGTAYSGEFVRGDADVIDFLILGRTESFNTADVDRVVFKEKAAAKTTAAAPAAAPAEQGKPEPLRRVMIVKNQRQQQPDEAAQRSGTAKATFPAGTPLTIRTTTVIDTDRNRVGDVFEATLENDLVFENRIVVPQGAIVRGRIAHAKESGAFTGKSELLLELTELIADDRSYLLRTSDYTEVGEDRGRRTATTIGGTTAAGTVIGAIAGGGRGAAIGAATGAAVGTGVQVATRGETLMVPAETILEFTLEAPLVINVRP